MKADVVNRIMQEKVIAIVRGYTKDECIKLARALSVGGVNTMEVTFHQTDAEDQKETCRILKALNEEMGGRMCIGAGTVTTTEMVAWSREAGCRFIVSPDTNLKVIKATVDANMVSIPGALTPTEIKTAWDNGADFVKVFPACNMGASYFKNISAPLAQVKLLAVGGIKTENALEYMKAGAAGVGVAGCLFQKEWIRAGEWNRITAAAEKLCTVLRNK